MSNRSLALLLLAATTLAAASPDFAIRDPRYKIHPTDRLEMSFRYSPEYNQTLIVQPDGFVSISLGGDVKLGGLTLDEARAALLKSLSDRLNDPEITLTLQDFVRPYFTVAGQVATPGRYEMHGPVTAVEGVAMAGGFREAAKHSKVILYRRLNNDMAEAHVIDMKKLVDSTTPQENEDFELQPGDLLVVPKSRIGKVERYVHWVNVGSQLPLL
jgi:polysaccharide export outer membrane protein